MDCGAGLTWLSSSVSPVHGGPHAPADITVLVRQGALLTRCAVLDGGLYWPCRDAFRRFHIFTVPLSPLRASFLLGGRNKHMGYEAYQVSLGLKVCRSALCWCNMIAYRAKA